MNDFLDNLGKVVNQTAKKAFKASGDVLELTKTSLNIKFDEAKRESFFKEIGKAVYDTYKTSPDSVSDVVLDLCKCIDELENAINAQKVKAASIKNKKFCVDCGVVLDKTVNYCYSCGAKQPEIPKDEDDCCCCCCDDDDECCCDDENCDCDDDCDCGCKDGEPCDCGHEEDEE